MKRIMRHTAIILATLATLLIAWQFKLVLLLFIASLFIAATIRPLVIRLALRGMSKGAAQILLYVVGIGGFLLLLLLASDLLLAEVNLAANRAVLEYDALYRSWEEGLAWQQFVVDALPSPFAFATAPDTDLEQMAPIVLSVTQGVLGFLGGLLLLLALSVYWSVDQHHFERLWLSLLAVRHRTYARDSWRKIETAVGKYLRSQTVQSLFAALFLAVGAKVIGFDFPLTLAFFAALAAFVPLFGGLLTAIFALLLGSLGGIGVGVVTAVYTILLFIGLELLVEPRLWPRNRRNFSLVILMILPLFEAFGLWGLIIAPPLAAALEVLLAQAYQIYMTEQDTAVMLDDLEVRYQQLSQNIDAAENGQVPPELRNLVSRLAGLLTDSRQMTNTPL